MKKQILILAMALIGTVFTSCEKDEATAEPPSREEILTEGEWSLDYIETKAFLNDSLMHTETETIGATVRFYKANYVVAKVPGQPVDTSIYVLAGDNFWLDDIQNEILVLDNSSFIFTFSETEQYPEGEVRMQYITNLSRK